MKHRLIVSLVIFAAAVGSTALATMWPVTAYQAVSVTAPTIPFGLADSELATADLAALTTGMTNVEKVWWSGRYTHRAANRQGALVQAWEAGTVSVMGRDVDIPQATLDDLKAEINALADRMVTAQTFVANLTD